MQSLKVLARSVLDKVKPALIASRRIWRVVRISLRRPFAARSPRRTWVLALGLALIPLWQVRFATNGPALDDKLGQYRLWGVSGMPHQQGLAYFLYFTGHYPLATTVANPERTKAAAYDIIENRGESLVMETGQPMFA